ncbi:MAG: hypothetical protein J6B80_04625 [Clostridia bacterium]|nr:hypothetical protein [Clostridia bacterium]
MTSFIEEFYYGNLDPQARSTKCSETVTKEISIIAAAEEYLISKLQGEEKSKFLEHIIAWSILNGETNLDSFIIGFRLGAKFTYDTFVNKNAPLKDLLEEQKYER